MRCFVHVDYIVLLKGSNLSLTWTHLPSYVGKNNRLNSAGVQLVKANPQEFCDRCQSNPTDVLHKRGSWQREVNGLEEIKQYFKIFKMWKANPVDLVGGKMMWLL